MKNKSRRFECNRRKCFDVEIDAQRRLQLSSLKQRFSYDRD